MSFILRFLRSAQMVNPRQSHGPPPLSNYFGVGKLIYIFFVFLAASGNVFFLLPLLPIQCWLPRCPLSRRMTRHNYMSNYFVVSINSGWFECVTYKKAQVGHHLQKDQLLIFPKRRRRPRRIIKIRLQPPRLIDIWGFRRNCCHIVVSRNPIVIFLVEPFLASSKETRRFPLARSD